MKVSVIVPTWRTAQKSLERLVDSLDAQTMPTTDFELIFVDDGSPDDTADRLRKFQESRPNVRVEVIEHSGWPCKPRNVGVELAHGEYVLFMDHDDALYPKALEAGYNFGAKNMADVVSGKETHTKESGWGLNVWDRNYDNAIDRTDIHPLIPTNPHKMYRRQLLLDNNIKFREGGRVMWEDIYFNADVAAHAKVISILSDTPFYHWVREGTTSSTNYTKDLAAWWRELYDICEYISNTLMNEPLQRRSWLTHMYRLRVLGHIGDAFKGDAFESAKRTVGFVQNDLIPEEWDADLPGPLRIRAALLRRDRWDLIPELLKIDRPGIIGISNATKTWWKNGALHIATQSRWSDLKTDEQMELISRDGRILFPVTKKIAAVVPQSVYDMTDDVMSASTTLGIRSRETRVSWLLPTQCKVDLEHIEGEKFHLVITSEGVFDARNAAMGQPLAIGVWDVVARNEIYVRTNQRGLRTTLPCSVELFDGHVFVDYRNGAGMLSVDIDQQLRSIAGSAHMDMKHLTVEGSSFSAPIRNGFSDDATTIDVPIVLVPVDQSDVDSRTISNTCPGRLVACDGGLVMTGTIEAAPGSYLMFERLPDRDVSMDTQVTIAPEGKLSFVHIEKAPASISIRKPAKKENTIEKARLKIGSAVRRIKRRFTSI